MHSDLNYFQIVDFYCNDLAGTFDTAKNLAGPILTYGGLGGVNLWKRFCFGFLITLSWEIVPIRLINILQYYQVEKLHFTYVQTWEAAGNSIERKIIKIIFNEISIPCV